MICTKLLFFRPPPLLPPLYMRRKPRPEKNIRKIRRTRRTRRRRKRRKRRSPRNATFLWRTVLVESVCVVSLLLLFVVAPVAISADFATSEIKTLTADANLSVSFETFVRVYIYICFLLHLNLSKLDLCNIYIYGHEFPLIDQAVPGSTSHLTVRLLLSAKQALTRVEANLVDSMNVRRERAGEGAVLVAAEIPAGCCFFSFALLLLSCSIDFFPLY